MVEVSFADGGKEKMVRHEDDKFDLRKCCFIAIAKHLYKKHILLKELNTWQVSLCTRKSM